MSPFACCRQHGFKQELILVDHVLRRAGSFGIDPRIVEVNDPAPEGSQPESRGAEVIGSQPRGDVLAVAQVSTGVSHLVHDQSIRIGVKKGDLPLELGQGGRGGCRRVAGNPYVADGEFFVFESTRIEEISRVAAEAPGETGVRKRVDEDRSETSVSVESEVFRIHDTGPLGVQQFGHVVRRRLRTLLPAAASRRPGNFRRRHRPDGERRAGHRLQGMV